MWHSYLINLEENKARLENSRRQLVEQGIAFTRIDAVNGWELNDEQINKVYDAKAANRYCKYPLTKPETGCYLSHINAWKKIAESSEKGGFVFEDDFKVVSPLAPILDKLSFPNRNWDIVKLFFIKKNPKIISSQKLHGSHDLVLPYGVPTTMLGYGITAKAAKHLVASSIPFFRPVDENHKFFWEKGLSIYLVFPSPIIIGDEQTKNGSIGDTRRSANRGSFTHRIARSFKSLSYQLDYQIRLYYYRKLKKYKD